MLELSSEISLPKLDVCWLAAPDERTAGFLQTFAEISVAIQTLLRERVPAAYFQNLANLRNLKTAYPMLLYQASQPFRGKMRSELTYDVLNPQTVAKFFRTAKPALSGLLAATEARLRAAGLDSVALEYGQHRLGALVQAVQKWNKSRKCLYALIRAESVLVNSAVELGGLGKLSPRLRIRRMVAFEKRWRFQLRRLYPGTDFTWLAPDLLDAATRALIAAQLRPPDAGGSDAPLTPDETIG